MAKAKGSRQNKAQQGDEKPKNARRTNSQSMLEDFINQL
jgi:hypothetical protein